MSHLVTFVSYMTILGLYTLVLIEAHKYFRRLDRRAWENEIRLAILEAQQKADEEQDRSDDVSAILAASKSVYRPEAGKDVLDQEEFKKDS